MGLVDSVEQWVLKVALKKVLTRVVIWLTAIITGAKVAPILSQLGVSIDPSKLMDGATLLAGAGMELLHDYLKVKYGSKPGIGKLL